VTPGRRRPRTGGDWEAPPVLSHRRSAAVPPLLPEIAPLGLPMMLAKTPALPPCAAVASRIRRVAGGAVLAGYAACLGVLVANV
jgi:hypothetical protein